MKNKNNINLIYEDLENLIITNNKNLYERINRDTLFLYWDIGKKISEINEKDNNKILELLSSKLTKTYDSSFQKENLTLMQNFYKTFPIWQKVKTELTWSHYKELIKIKDETKRDFYIKESIRLNLNTEELKSLLKKITQ